MAALVVVVLELILELLQAVTEQQIPAAVVVVVDLMDQSRGALALADQAL
jgi:hypothetical protein